jgi:hypothetical protein
MIVEEAISIATIKLEIAECTPGIYGWSFSEIDEANLSFQVNMHAKDNERYIVNIKFDNYRYWPLLIDFADPETNEIGVKTAYPYCNDGFFNKDKITICHPCSRKAYKGYTSIHTDWGELSAWESIPTISTLKSLRPILEAIYFRINSDDYVGRMEKKGA